MQSYRARTPAALLVLLSATALGGTASAQVFTQRDSAYTITFPSGLNSATTYYSVTATMPPSGGDSIGGTLSFKTSNQGVIVGTTGTVTTTYSNAGAGTPSEVGNVINGGGGGTFSFNYTTPNGPDFTSSWTISTVANGHNVVAFGGVGGQGFGGGGSGLIDIGGIFTVEVFIAGDWNPGTATGDAYITNLGAGYSVVDNFVYDSAINATILSVSTGKFDGTNPSLGFNLVGSAVPEPSTWAMMLLGFAGLGYAGYRKTKNVAAA